MNVIRRIARRFCRHPQISHEQTKIGDTYECYAYTVCPNGGCFYRRTEDYVQDVNLNSDSRRKGWKITAVRIS